MFGIFSRVSEGNLCSTGFAEGVLVESRSHVIVAVIFLVTLLLGAVFVAWWMQRGRPEEKTYLIISPYDISNLQIQAPVKFKGVRVGSVKSVELDPKAPNKVRIEIGVTDRTPVNQTTYAQISSTGVTGLTIIALHNKKADAPSLKTSDKQPAAIPMRQSFLQQVESRGAALLSQSQQAVQRLNALLDQDNRAKVTGILDHLDQATKKLVAAENALLPALRRMDPMAKSAQDTLTQTTALLETMRSDAQAFHKLMRSSIEVTNTFSNHTLPQFNELARHVEEAVMQIDALTSELKRNPSSVIYGEQRPPGPGEPGYQPGAPGMEQ